MNILFVHQNFPGQYRHLSSHLAAMPGNQVVSITQRKDAVLPGVRNIVYSPQRKTSPHQHHYLRDTEAGVLNAQAVARVALSLKMTYPFVLSWSMLEAMAAGCLVVGSRTAPVEEVIRDGENGVLVDFFRPDEIAERVRAVLAEPGRFAGLRDQARRTVVEAYDLKRICLPRQLRLLKTVCTTLASHAIQG